MGVVVLNLEALMVAARAAGIDEVKSLELALGASLDPVTMHLVAAVVCLFPSVGLAAFQLRTVAVAYPRAIAHLASRVPSWCPSHGASRVSSPASTLAS